MGEMNRESLVGGAVLVVAAAPAEARAVAAAFGASEPDRDWLVVRLAEGWDLVRCGVGKVNAAACVAVCQSQRKGLAGTVLNVGVCGALPGTNAPGLGDVVVASASVYADEGVLTPDGFKDMATMGFAPWPGAGGGGVAECSRIVADAALVGRAEAMLRGEFGSRVSVGPIATVSTCSGTDALAAEVAQRTGAIAEAMEGAAIGHVLTRLGGLAFLEIRVVSNTTGVRAKQAWDLKGALSRVTQIMATLGRAAR